MKPYAKSKFRKEMHMLKMVIVSLFFAAGVSAQTANVMDVLVDSVHCRGAHVSTRPHNRKVIYHEGSDTWYVFYGTGHWMETDPSNESLADQELIAWRSSTDSGATWSDHIAAIAGNGHSSSSCAILAGNTIYMSNMRWHYWRQLAGVPYEENGRIYYHRSKPDTFMFYAPYEVFPFQIESGNLVLGQPSEALPGDQHVMHAGPHYGSMTRDSNGYLWVAARALTPASGGGTSFDVWVARSLRPDDPTEWQPHTVVFQGAGGGSVAPQVVALSSGRVACVIHAKYEAMTTVALYNPVGGTWSFPQRIGSGTGSKRTCAVFDPGSERLHVVYTDSAGDARHRACTAPYDSSNWSPPLSEPGAVVARQAGTNQGDDDLTLSVDRSQNPAPLALVHRGPDLRLHLSYYNGAIWGPGDVKIGSQDPRFTCDEATAVEDFSQGLGFLYWARWANAADDEQHHSIGHMRFCLVRDVASLFGRFGR